VNILGKETEGLWCEVRILAALYALEECRYPSNPRKVGTTGSTI
jgi:hypothetical protein